LEEEVLEVLEDSDALDLEESDAFDSFLSAGFSEPPEESESDAPPPRFRLP
jgi:hypothetical protein